MAILTEKELNALESLFNHRESHGKWESSNEAVHLVSWTHPTEPLYRDPDNEGLKLQDVDPEHRCVATLGHWKDMRFIAEANNQFPLLIEMARSYIHLMEETIETLVHDGFSYAESYHYIGERTLMSAARRYLDIGKDPDKWIEYVATVLEDTCHSSYDLDQVPLEEEDRLYIAVSQAWGSNEEFFRYPQDLINFVVELK